MALHCIEGGHRNNRVQQKNTSNLCRIYDEKVPVAMECGLGRGGSRNQNEEIRSVKGASMNAYTVRILQGMV